MKKRLPILYIIIAAFLWGIIGIFFKFLSSYGYSNIQTVFFRTAVAAAGLFLVIIISNKSALKIKLRDLWCFIGTGVISLFTFCTCYFYSITYIGIPISATLLYTAPAFVTILSIIIFKEKPTIGKFISIFLTVVGCALVSGVMSSSTVSIKGLIFGLGSGIGYALYSIFSRFAINKGYHSITISFYTFLFAACSSFIMMFIVGDGLPTIVPLSIPSIIGIGVLCCILPYLAYTKGLEYVSNSKASIIATLEPVVAALSGVILFNEKLTIEGLVGIFLVLSAVILSNITITRKG